MQRVVLVILIAVVLVAVAFFAMDRGDVARADDRSMFETEATEPLEPEHDRTDQPLGDESSRVTVEQPTTPEPSDEDGLHGTFVLVDAEGVEHRNESGTFDLVLWDDNYGKYQDDVPIVDGAWGCAVQDDRELTKVGVRNIRLGDREVFVDEEFPIERDGERYRPIELRGRVLPVQQLRVLDAVTRIDLADVTVVRVTDWERDDYVHPGHPTDYDVITEAQRSPVPVRRTRSMEETLWVGAPNYAWNKMRISHEAQREWEVLLEPGGSLEVFVRGHTPALGDARLRIREPLPATPKLERPDGISDEAWASILESMQPSARLGRPFADFRVAGDGPIRIEGLAAGRHHLRIERGKWFRKPAGFAEATVEITAGAHATVEMVIDEGVLPPARAVVSGTVHVPESWKPRLGRIEFRAIGALRAWDDDDHVIYRSAMKATGTPGVWEWNAGARFIGDYQVLVTPFDYRQRVTVGAGGNRDVRIELPEPADLHVRVVDEAGRPIPGATVGWHSKLARGISSTGVNRAKPDEDGVVRFQAPPGTVDLSGDAEGFHHSIGGKPHTVNPGRNDIVLTMRRVCGVEVVLEVDGQELPYDSDWHFTMQPKSGTGRTLYWSGPRLAASEPGTWEVRIPEIPGYRTVPVQTVEILPADWARLVVRLERQQ